MSNILKQLHAVSQMLLLSFFPSQWYLGAVKAVKGENNILKINVNMVTYISRV